jgi:type IV secretory pathway TraG/TraD family ATPase VirD4
VATSLRPDPSRRVWLALDEIPILLPSPTIGTVLSEGRKFGLSIIMAGQAVGQFKSRVGADEAAALLSMPKTRLLLRVGDGETAEAMSREIGDRHIKRKQVSHNQSSGGGGQGGGSSSGTSTSWQDTTERAVLPSEIMALPDLTGYLRVETTTMRVRLAWQAYPTVAEDYQPVPPRPLPVPAES